MSLDAQFQIAVIIDKLAPLWKDYKNTLRQKIKKFSLESQITWLRIKRKLESKTRKSNYPTENKEEARKQN